MSTHHHQPMQPQQHQLQIKSRRPHLMTAAPPIVAVGHHGQKAIVVATGMATAASQAKTAAAWHYGYPRSSSHLYYAAAAPVNAAVLPAPPAPRAVGAPPPRRHQAYPTTYYHHHGHHHGYYPQHGYYQRYDDTKTTTTTAGGTGSGPTSRAALEAVTNMGNVVVVPVAAAATAKTKQANVVDLTNSPGTSLSQRSTRGNKPTATATTTVLPSAPAGQKKTGRAKKNSTTRHLQMIDFGWVANRSSFPTNETEERQRASNIRAAISQELSKLLPPPEHPLYQTVGESDDDDKDDDKDATTGAAAVKTTNSTTAGTVTAKASAMAKAVSNNSSQSPVTMCIDRMLQAAALVKTPHPSSLPKRQKASKDAAASEPVDDEEAPTTNVGKRKYNKRATQVAEEKKAEELVLGPGHPFYEIANNADLYQRVVLQMALQREPTAKDIVEPVSKVIPEGFYWRDYPALEQVLFDNMLEYYQVSCSSRQSKAQQDFNNLLVDKILAAATQSNWTFDLQYFTTDKKLRDRIRCFYKTHLQNAKKRLATMHKQPHRPDYKAQVGRVVDTVRAAMATQDGNNNALSFAGGEPPKKLRRKQPDYWNF